MPPFRGGGECYKNFPGLGIRSVFTPIRSSAGITFTFNPAVADGSSCSAANFWPSDVAKGRQDGVSATENATHSRTVAGSTWIIAHPCQREEYHHIPIRPAIYLTLSYAYQRPFKDYFPPPRHLQLPTRRGLLCSGKFKPVRNPPCYNGKPGGFSCQLTGIDNGIPLQGATATNQAENNRGSARKSSSARRKTYGVRNSRLGVPAPEKLFWHRVVG